MKMRKLVAMLLAVLMLCSIIPFSAAAEGTSAVIDFTDKANRTAYSTSQQVWEQNGIVVTNDKGASTSNVGDYGGDGYPARFYKSSTVKIEYPGMTKIVIDCNGLESKYVNGWADSATGATATVDGTIVTIELAAAADSFTWAPLTAQSRAYKITVYTGDTPVTPEPPVTPDPEPDVPSEPEADSELSVADAIALALSKEHNIYTTGKYFVTGVITEVYNTQYGNMKIKDDAGNILTIYGTYSADGSTRYDAMEVKPVAGDTVTIYGIIGQYNGTPQIKNGWITAHTAAGGDTPVTPEPPVTPDPEPDVSAPTVVTNPVEGVAYKLGLDQTQKGAIYYFTGKMSGYYGATEADLALAVDMYVEIVDGGYLLYFNDANGAKKYIKLVQSGTHYNFTFAADGSVFTLDAERNAFCAPCGDQICYMGTYGSYVTIGTLTTAKMTATDYIARLYSIGGETPECEHAYDNACDADCNLCGETREVAEHVYDDEYDADCNECGATREVPEKPVDPVVGGGFADFDGIVLPSSKPNGDSSYTATYTTPNGWVTEFSAIQCGGSADINPQFVVVGPDNTHKAVCMNGKVSAPGKITSPTLTGGISKLTINYTKMFTDTKLSATVTITDVATGTVYTHTIYKEADKNTKYEIWTDEWVLDTPITGDFTIVISNDAPSAATGNKDRMTILDVIWEGAANDPEPPVIVIPETPEGAIHHAHFQTGETHGWGTSSEGSVVAGNDGMVYEFNITKDWGNLYNYLNVEKNTDYIVSFDAKAATAKGMWVKFNNNWAADVSDATVNLTTEWANYSVTLNSGDLTSVVFMFQHPGYGNEGQIVWFDNITVVKAPAAVEPSFDGYITNGDFETGDLTAWKNLWGSCTVNFVEGYESNKALHLQCGQWQQVRQDGVVVTPNTEYVLSIWAKDATNFTLLVKKGDDSGNIKEIAIPTSAEWTKYELKFNSGDESSICVLLMGNNPDCSAIIDNVSLALAPVCAHEYDNACDVDCNLCGETREVTHTVLHVTAKAATCTENGNIEYWYCEICGMAWLDEACTQNTNLKAVVLPAAGEHTYSYPCDPDCDLCGEIRELVAGGGTDSFNMPDYVVSGELGGGAASRELNDKVTFSISSGWFTTQARVYKNGNAIIASTTPISSITINASSNKDANTFTVNVSEDGTTWTAYQTPAYEKAYTDVTIDFATPVNYVQFVANNAQIRITTMSITFAGGSVHNIVAVDAVAPTCDTLGNIAYWYCADCGQAWLDAECTLNTNLKAVILPIAHNVIHVEAKDATCYEPGNIEYWYCELCGQAWLDELCHQNTNLKAVVLPIAHNVIHVEAKDATCDEPGNIEYWYCDLCGQAWLDELCHQNTNLKAVVLPITHNVIHVVAKDATCNENGNIEYWYCELCGQAWLDELCHMNTNLKAVILPATGEHVYDDKYDADCNVCGTIREVEPKPAIAVSTIESKAGETVNVTVSMTNNPGIISAKVKVYFDNTVLKLVGYTAGNFAEGGYSWGDDSVANTNGYFIINWCDAVNPDSTADLLATLTFEVLEGAAEGLAAITLEFSCEDDIFNAAFETVEFDAVSGGVQVIAPAIQGDANGDGKVNNRDLALLQVYLNDGDIAIDEVAADLNADGKLNNRDLAALQVLLNNN